MKKGLYVLAMASVSALGFSQAVITSGSSSFGWTTSTALSAAANRTGSGGGASHVFTGLGSPDQSFQEWWWYRVNGVNSREFALSTQANAPVVSGNHMTLSYREPEGFTSTIMYTINNIGGTALVTGTNFVQNEGNTALSMDFFHYVDYDIAGSTNDRATLITGNPALRMRVFDTNSPVSVEYRALDASLYRVGPFSAVRTSLSNTGIDNYDNTGLPFGPGDFTGGVQWRFTLNPGDSIALQTSRVLNPVPEPASMIALAGGLALLLRRRRKVA